MDTKVRDKLTAEEQKSLGSLAEHVMSYLEINRDAIEGRRSKRMFDALNHFIEGKSGFSEIELPSNGQPERTSKRRRRRFNPGDVNLRDSSGSSADEEDTSRDQIGRNQYDEREIESVSHNKVFARAANLLREAFELDEGGGVMFVGATKALRHEHGAGVALHTASDAKYTNGEVDGEEEWPIPSPTHQISTTTTFDPILNVFAKHTENPSPLLALSSHDTPFAPESLLSDPKAAACGQVDKDVLRKLFRKYPGGRLWIFDEIGLLSASDDEHKFTKKADRKEPARLPNSSSWSRDEPTLLRNAFPGVRQLMFAPNWDAETSDWTSACFVWSRNDCVLTSATDLTFLNSFTKTVMAELSRLDAVLADKQKGDFIGSISHELRSPLHGILASAEFLGETPGTTFQRNLISTVDACGRTLLDTINHILDYSKINSFERNWQNMGRSKPKARRVKAGSIANPFERTLPSGAPPLLRMYDITDVAAITEEVVEAIAVGQLYSHATEICDVTPRNRGRGAGKGLRPRPHNLGGRGKGFDEAERVEVIIDIDRGDWVFLTQPGALRRVIMNLVGNAIKYTTHGTIKIRLQLKNLDSAGDESKMMILTVMDTGKGISPMFLSTMLFVPFAQVWTDPTSSPG
jgi:signal transduction histidine kinase